MFRIGQGYDVHRLVPDRDLWICGVKIPYDLGLLGHSDADVALHALMDALLGAAALRDIGYHFPDTDPHYKGADSRLLLRAVRDLLHNAGYTIGNVDVTVIAQAPKMRPYIQAMIDNISKDLEYRQMRYRLKPLQPSISVSQAVAKGLPPRPWRY